MKVGETSGATSESGTEYYQLWRSTGGPSSSDTTCPSMYPPPLPPRGVYPLQKMPTVLPRSLKMSGRHNQKMSTPLHPEDCFNFEIVDVDETNNSKV